MVATMPARRPPTNPLHPLRQWRELHDVSQEAVADACGISQAAISYIEAGKKAPRGKVVEALHDYTGLPPEAFLWWERFLKEEPNFLRKYRRPTRPSKEE
jgi:transcriptional regulator with XRE-family HTH domain